MTDELEPISKRIPNAKWRLFIDELFKNNMNQTAAYMAAYPDASYETAMANSSTLVRKTKIAEEVERRLKEKAMSVDEIIARISDIAAGSLEDFYTFKEGIKQPFLDLEKAKKAGKLHLIKELKYDEYGRPEIKLYPSPPALQDLAKWRKLFTDTDNGPQEVINYSIDEWRAEQERRRAEAEQAQEDFED